EGEPGSPQRTARTGTDEFEIQLRMVEVDNFKGTVAVAGGGETQLPIPGLVGIGGTRSLALQRLGVARSVAEGGGKGGIAGGKQAALGTKLEQTAVGGHLRGLGRGLIPGGDDVLKSLAARV